jgi:hypothetical protein
MAGCQEKFDGAGQADPDDISETDGMHRQDPSRWDPNHALRGFRSGRGGLRREATDDFAGLNEFRGFVEEVFYAQPFALLSEEIRGMIGQDDECRLFSQAGGVTDDVEAAFTAQVEVEDDDVRAGLFQDIGRFADSGRFEDGRDGREGFQKPSHPISDEVRVVDDQDNHSGKDTPFWRSPMS